ncbi:metallophosphoesterase [Alteribacillus sp. YIM 98480]|uniref:metallophosphoesterase n=1 Tax=Alteribacillus sp. YIM 98480 TaxID=2606599 RepID=UPI00131D7E69|nr:metallophosphoesterase [Alteribacillus sp. YIM 98480]
METKQPYLSLIIIPDTQYLPGEYPEYLRSMNEKIIKSAAQLHIPFVLHVGDIVNSGAQEEKEYEIAASEMRKLSDAEIPYVISPGNHDYDNLLKENRQITMFNHYFGPALYRDKTWFGGVYEQGHAENMFVTFEAAGRSFLILILEFGPRDDVLAWADQIIKENSERKVIVLTHTFMYINGERTKEGDTHHPRDYSGAIGANDGEEIWNKCIRKHKNVLAVFSGHHVPRNISYRMDFGDQGNPVFQSFQNWQKTRRGGEGRYCIFNFFSNEQEIECAVFHPANNTYEKASGYRVQMSDLL